MKLEKLIERKRTQVLGSLREAIPGESSDIYSPFAEERTELGLHKLAILLQLARGYRKPSELRTARDIMQGIHTEEEMQRFVGCIEYDLAHYLFTPDGINRKDLMERIRSYASSAA